MLSNDEIQKIIADIESGAYDISDVLEAIATAAKGEDVRAALYAEAYAIRNAAINGQPKVITLAENMKNPDIKYLYLGSEAGYSYGYVYAYVEDEWTKTNLYGEGYSPAVTITQIPTGARVTVTDGHGTTTADIENGTATDAQVETYVADWLDEHPEATTTVQDGSITEEKLSALLLAKINTGGLTPEIKVALLDCFAHVEWADGDGQEYYDALEAALYPPANLVSISALFNSGATTIYNTNTLNDLKQYLVVTALYDDLTTETVSNYTLSGALSTGTQTITVAYGGKTTTFNVTVVDWLTSISAVYTQSGTVYDVDTLNSLKSDLVVTALYGDSSTETITDYTLSGTLAEGTSTITVTYAGKTTTFNVTVTTIEWYTVQSSDVGGWNYPSYDGTSYAKANNLNNLASGKTALKFVQAMNGTRPILWDNVPATAEYVRYDDGLVATFNNNGSSSANSALKSLTFGAAAIAMLRTLTIQYAPNLTEFLTDLSEALNLTQVKLLYNDNLVKLPSSIPNSVTEFLCQYNAGLTDLSDWETPTGVTGLRTSFKDCTSLEKGPIINAPNCVTFNIMFQNCAALKEITIEDVNTDYLYSGNTGLLSNAFANIGMVKCDPLNDAFPVIRAKLAASDLSYNDMKHGLTGRTGGTVKRICMYGDSLTKYNGDTGTYGTMPAQLLGLMANNVAVHNFGYAGSTALSYKSYFDARTELQADVSVVWFGTNNVSMSGEDIAAQIQTNIISGLTSDHYIVIGLLQKNYTADRNTAMASAFGDRYLDIHAYTLANWETITGLTPTAEDETAVSNGNIPPSLLQSDSTHLNAYSGLIVATAIKEKLLSLGYITNDWLANQNS